MDIGRVACSVVDNFSRLPDEPFLRIISLLPMKDAVRTSVLSSCWRYLYASMSDLVVGVDFEESIDVASIVDRLFSFRNTRCPIDKFRLCWSVSRTLDPLHIQGWIETVMWHGIRNLDLVISAKVQLPSSLCACKTLEVLHVHMMSESESDPCFEIPAKVCLPNLKVLQLGNLMFSDDDSLNRLISNCPVLENLLCYFRYGDCKLNISNPTLKILSIRLLYSERLPDNFEILINAPNIEDLVYSVFGVTSPKFVHLKSLASTSIEIYHDGGDVSHHINAATDLMRAITNIQTLHISALTLTELYNFNISIPVFHFVTHLTVFRCDFSFKALLHFLERCESLEVLVFEEDILCNFDGSNPLEECRVNCLSSRLKTIEFYVFEGGYMEMELAKFFLKSGKCLESMKIEIEDSRSFEEKYKISRKLLMFPRASKECKVVLASQSFTFE